jgi:hypothetical protein
MVPYFHTCNIENQFQRRGVYSLASLKKNYNPNWMGFLHYADLSNINSAIHQLRLDDLIGNIWQILANE